MVNSFMQTLTNKPTANITNEPTTTTLNNQTQFVFITKDRIVKMKKSELQDQIKLQGLATRGNTLELLDQILKAMRDKFSLADSGRDEKAHKYIFSDGMTWKYLIPSIYFSC